VALVPKDSGALASTIKIRLQAKSKKFGWVRYHLSAGDRKKGVWYAHLVEFGTASFYTGTGRSKRKPYEIKAKDGGSLKFGNAGQVEKVTHPSAKPSPFMRPALDANTDAALQAFAATARRRTESEVRKLVRAKGRAALDRTEEALTDA
jgi:HK97 gp10 family phage protein